MTSNGEFLGSSGVWQHWLLLAGCGVHVGGINAQPVASSSDILRFFPSLFEHRLSFVTIRS